MNSISRDDIKSLIQEWFCDCTTVSEVALLYGDMYHEILQGLDERLRELET